MLSIGEYRVASRVILAPMAGVTDKPFRELCRALGGGLAISEMVSSDVTLWNRDRSRLRMALVEDGYPPWMQIVGADPVTMADAAVRCVDQGAAIIDINMGCPAKKVCKRAAGSALMRDLDLAADIVCSVVAAVDVPVTLKMRTGWREGERTAVTLARIAEANGIAAVTVHGRSGEQRFTGEAEYATIAEVKASIGIPVIANGDIDAPEKAVAVLDATGADGIMVGRGALGAPWLVGEIDRHLHGGEESPAFDMSRRGEVVASHVTALHRFYGERTGVRFARKHMGWYLAHDGEEAKAAARGFNHLPTAAEQLDFIAGYFSGDPRTLAA